MMMMMACLKDVDFRFLLPRTKIAIIGAGPAGCTLARLLHTSNLDTIFERDELLHVRSQGGTLDLHPKSGIAASKAGGLYEESRFDGGNRSSGIEEIVDEQLNLHFDNGVEKGFDRVAGADGAWSNGRNLLTNESPSYNFKILNAAEKAPALSKLLNRSSVFGFSEA
ncbi:hypothetical protein B7494_g3708 [Chlorociboria aeruginascens]|nr:hypothetical protein B7494_g3708 [Chlorociboria aeruginascens]